MAELRGIKIGWRFSLRFIKEENAHPPELVEAMEGGLRYHRI
ncbi:MAG TPA: hypothetical protein VM942_10490 [Acidimicrobiales bacterium]|nr:hypothetical protein [Acidimicrobiales bacterium]